MEASISLKGIERVYREFAATATVAAGYQAFYSNQSLTDVLNYSGK